ncbi:MAG: methyltransferase domain-containing protein [Thermoanaerobaculia bacterium]
MKDLGPPPDDPVAADLDLAAANANPAVLPPGTRAALPKRLLLRLLRLYTAGQVRFNYAAARLLAALEARIRELQEAARDLRRLQGEAIKREGLAAGRLAELETGLQRLRSDTDALAGRVERISPPRLEQMFVPGAYAEFERQFRGSREEILERQRVYVSPLREAAARVGPSARFLDLGCGRGELLELAREAGLAMTGIDSETSLVEACRTRGLDAREADLFDALWGQPEESLAGVTALQVVEHLPWAAVRTLVDLAYQRIRPGGCLILETINPASVYAMRTFHLDPTHRQPVPSETVHFLLSQAGFRDVEVRWLNPVDDPKIAKAIEGDESLKALADLLLGFRDYAVVGWRR